MSRSLRTRTSITNYAALPDNGDEDEVIQLGPSRLPLEDDAGSDFAPGGDAASDAEHNDDQSEMTLVPNSIVSASSRKGKMKGKPKRKGKADDASKEPSTAEIAAFERPSYRQMYTLPQPSVNHRHKAVPVFRHSAPTERLIQPPRLFEDNPTVPTNAYTSSQTVTERLNRALGYNIAAGPLWELLEDRGWFKEGDWTVDNPSTEAGRRPRVYSGIPIHSQWSTMTGR